MPQTLDKCVERSAAVLPTIQTTGQRLDAAKAEGWPIRMQKLKKQNNVAFSSFANLFFGHASKYFILNL